MKFILFFPVKCYKLKDFVILSWILDNYRFNAVDFSFKDANSNKNKN